MRIGILTLPLHTNYGGILQAYALQTVLERMGHEVVVIDTPRMYKKPAYWKYPYRAIKKMFIDSDVVIESEKKYLQESPVIEREIRRFIKDEIHTYKVNRLTDIQECDFDCIVVGSDQVWRPLYFCKMWKTSFANAFLAFSNDWNIKRIAYAPSFGTDKWEYIDNCEELCKAIKLFDAISVRELSGVKICHQHMKVDAKQVLDPTMLLTKEDYVKLFIKNHPTRSSGNLLCYILDENASKKGLIERVSRERRLMPFHVNVGILGSGSIEQRIKPSIETWLRGFYDADMVITDSFHACVFSILFGKPFIAIGNTERGMGRFFSLLEMFGLRNNLLTDVAQYNPDCDYSLKGTVPESLSKWRMISNDYLVNALNR